MREVEKIKSALLNVGKTRVLVENIPISVLKIYLFLYCIAGQRRTIGRSGSSTDNSVEPRVRGVGAGAGGGRGSLPIGQHAHPRRHQEHYQPRSKAVLPLP